MTDDECAARFLIAGTVQGVFFRASTKMKAESLGLSGYARNLEDGRVEVLAAGRQQAVGALADWLRDGPPGARVERVERFPAERTDAPNGFDVRR